MKFTLEDVVALIIILMTILTLLLMTGCTNQATINLTFTNITSEQLVPIGSNVSFYTSYNRAVYDCIRIK